VFTNGSEGIWKSTFRCRRSAVRIDIMRSRVRLPVLGCLSSIAAFQRMEKRIGWYGYVARTSPFSRIDQLPSPFQMNQRCGRHAG
jgi:hypothetical protein